MGVAMNQGPTKARGVRRVPRWVMGAVVLPVAVLATVATSTTEEPRPASIISVGERWVASDDYSGGRLVWKGDGWAQLEVVTAGEEPRPFGNETPPSMSGPVQWIDCLESEPTRCYRAVEDAPAVDSSSDGGATWQREWALTDADVAAPLDPSMSALSVVGTGIGVAETPEGEEVWLALGTGGLVVRHPDGTWEREGFTPFSRYEDAPTVIPSEFDTRTSEWARRAFGFGLAGTMLFGPHAAFFAALATRARVRGTRWKLAGLGIASLAVYPLLAAVAIDHEFASGRWPHFELTTSPSLVAWAAGVAALWGLGVAGGLRDGAPRRAAWLTVAMGAPAGIAGGWITWQLGILPLLGAHLGVSLAAVAGVAMSWRVATGDTRGTPHGGAAEASYA